MTEATQRKLAPGPAGQPLVGNLNDFKKDPLAFFMTLRRDYGKVVRVHFGPTVAHFVSHPDWIRYVLATHSANYTKSHIGGESPVVGQGLIASEGDYWKRQRKLAQPAFHLEHINAFAATITQAADEMLASWEAYATSGEAFDVAPEMAHLTMTILIRTLFGTNTRVDTSGVGPALTTLLQYTSPTNRLSLFRLPESIPTRRNREFRAAI